MRDYKQETLDQIKANTAKINPKAYIAAIKAIVNYDAGPINGDCTLDRLSALCNVIYRHNAQEYVAEAKLSIDLLNQWRSLQGHKPQGFDLLIDLEERNVFRCAIEAGFGEEQLKAAAWFFNYEQLRDLGLIRWRTEGREQLICLES